MTKDDLKWLTGAPPRDGRVLIETASVTGTASLFAAEVKNGQFWLGKIGFGPNSKITTFAYLDDDPNATVALPTPADPVTTTAKPAVTETTAAPSK